MHSAAARLADPVETGPRPARTDATPTGADRPEPEQGLVRRNGDIHSGRLLAPGETLLWEGRPSGLGIAIRAFPLPIVAAYFAVLAGLDLVEAQAGRATLSAAAMPLATGLATIAILFGLAAIVARTTRYLVTTERVILRYGAVLPRSLAIPFRQIAALDVSLSRGGRGEISLALRRTTRIPYLKLWPHARPWRLRHPEVMLRDIPDAGPLATRLARWLADSEHRRGEERSRISDPEQDAARLRPPEARTAASR